jgi:hypothetical protein
MATGLSSQADAAWLGLRNDLSHAVVIQATTTSPAGTRQEPSFTLAPGEITWAWVAEKTVRHITIHDARPPRGTLTRVQADLAKGDQLYIIQTGSRPGNSDKTVQVVRGSNPPKK